MCKPAPTAPPPALNGDPSAVFEEPSPLLDMFKGCCFGRRKDQWTFPQATAGNNKRVVWISFPCVRRDHTTCVVFGSNSNRLFVNYNAIPVHQERLVRHKNLFFQVVFRRN